MKNPIRFILLIILDLLLFATVIVLFMQMCKPDAKEPEVGGKVVYLESDYAICPLEEMCFQVVPIPEPIAPDFVFEFEEKITEHDLKQSDIDLLARLLWSSPLENEDYKRQLLWIVFNRVDDERSGLFGRTIDTVVIQSEFAFFDKKAHLSETNLRIAREEMNRWLSFLDGNYVEIPIPRDAVYARFKGNMNRQLEVLTDLKEG